MKYLINPFEHINGWQALMMGFVAMSLTAVAGNLNHIAFDGVFDVHTGNHSLLMAFVMQAVNFLSVFIMMGFVAVCFSGAKWRVAEVAGIAALARAPMLLLSILCFLPIVPFSLVDFPRIMIFPFICILSIIWMIALLYHGYKKSCHLRSTMVIPSLIGVLLFAEVISKLILTPVLNNSPTENLSENMIVPAGNPSLTIRQKTEYMVAAFERGDFDAITVYFDKTMKKALSPSQLKMAWTQAGMTFGRFEKADLDRMKETATAQYDIIEVPVIFEKKTLQLRITFNRDGNVSGLYIQP